MAPATGNPGAPSTAVAAVPEAANAGAQTATAIDMKQFADAPVFSVADVLRESPGVSLKQGNGPRDMGISIRGSNACNGFGVRNIVILEDGFPVTQPDGLSRSDLIDPHAYSGIDVWRGPSSALFGNYTTGGAFNFRTRPGGEINGVEYGVDVGSFNYLNNYVSAGTKTWNFEGSVFISDVRGERRRSTCCSPIGRPRPTRLPSRRSTTNSIRSCRFACPLNSSDRTRFRKAARPQWAPRLDA